MLSLRLILTLVFEKIKVLPGKLEYTLLVYYIIYKLKIIYYENAQLKAAAKSFIQGVQNRHITPAGTATL